MILSTSGAENKPSSRVVLLKEYSDKGFVFFTNYRSRKGEEMAQNSNVSLLFFWPQLHRQVRIEGIVKKTSAKESDEYFKTRPLESQAAAIVSRQSSEVENTEEFYKAYQNKLQNESLIRPKLWGGYIVIPQRFEFWQGRPSRLHDRFQYELVKKKWRIVRLYP
jgi:pyridoxamine 5'-phosphate oxidase